MFWFLALGFRVTSASKRGMRGKRIGVKKWGGRRVCGAFGSLLPYMSHMSHVSHVCACVRVCACVCVYNMYVCICMYVCMYICICIHTHTQYTLGLLARARQV